MTGYSRGFVGLPPVVKNLILINVFVLLADFTAANAFNISLSEYLGLHFPKSELFRPVQIITHMFMHGGFAHLFFNMFALFMFGRVLETVWGPRRFLIYYFVSGLGAALIHEAVIFLQYSKLLSVISPAELQTVLDHGIEYIRRGQVFTNPVMREMQLILNTPTVGASGAVFGILLAFGVLFPNTRLMLLFPPIPIKAKYFVLAYGAIELYLAIMQPGSNVAHAAHIGGMLFGYILIRIWRKTTTTLY
ncbi:MAG: rhomboid family intramembrane serine protease [Bacteroidales bacterium]|jgi:membrane associated rhomboid family serine protease|nr:rhomboid family intramembrane serine protease [Bacteroidales bacterium]